jgi:hypothetical protein
MSSCKYRFVDLFERPLLLQTLISGLVLAVEIVQIRAQNPPVVEVRVLVMGVETIFRRVVVELYLRPWFQIQIENSS